MGRLNIWKNPFCCVVVERSRPVCVLCTVTVEPGTAAPELSRTVPFNAPRVCCATSGGAKVNARTRATMARAQQRTRAYRAEFIDGLSKRTFRFPEAAGNQISLNYATNMEKPDVQS